MRVRFDGNGSHFYSKDGTPKHDADLRQARKEGLFPSVTTIDSATFPNEFLQKWKLNQLLEAAAENHKNPHESVVQYQQRIYDLSMEKSKIALVFGKEIHDAIENHPVYPTDERLLPWVIEYDRWHRDNVKETISREKVLLDHDIGVAGRTDHICILSDGRRAIVDPKTQGVKVDEKGRKKPAFYDSWLRQLAFYAVCDAKETNLFPSIPVCISLCVDSEDGGLIYPKEHTKQDVIDAYETFLHGVWIWQSDHIRGYHPVGKWKVKDIPLPI